MESCLKFVAIVQARMNSTRLPGKVLSNLAGQSVILVLLSRLTRSERLDEIVVATTDTVADDKLAQVVSQAGYRVFRGSQNDVLERFLSVAEAYSDDTNFVRVTGDCPLIDPQLIDDIIDRFVTCGLDYCSNTIRPTFPDGLDTEVFSFSALSLAGEKASSSFDREHVTPWIKTSNVLKLGNFENKHGDYSNLRWTLDYLEDLEFLRALMGHFGDDINVSWEELLKYCNENQKINKFNQNFERDSGSRISTGNKLWKRGKAAIPGGNMLLSKRPEMHGPNFWPPYFERAKGCFVWDLDGVRYADVYLMGVGTNILGYGNVEVDAAVTEAISKSNVSSLNCPEEVYLAEKLLVMHPWSGGVRFARTGGEANAIAVRLARAYSGRDKVAFCGYHGWHDWYLSANLKSNDQLAGHLLPGLDPLGVPQQMAGLTIPFSYNDPDRLAEIIATGGVGAIMMEVSRNQEPEVGFLQKIRRLADEHAIPLIFDECTSGFRETFGGLHKKYDVEPDLVTYGKALGNGYAITAVVGCRAIMEKAQSTFISSTFWTERIGNVAALKTLEIMERDETWLKISEMGREVKKRWLLAAQKSGVQITVSGLESMPAFSFTGNRSAKYKTIFAREMLKRSFLAGNSIYLSVAHSKEVIDEYLDALENVFSLIGQLESRSDDDPIFDFDVCHSGFSRLN